MGGVILLSYTSVLTVASYLRWLVLGASDTLLHNLPKFSHILRHTFFTTKWSKSISFVPESGPLKIHQPVYWPPSLNLRDIFCLLTSLASARRLVSERERERPFAGD